MNVIPEIATLQQTFGKDILNTEVLSDKRASLTIHSSKIIPVAEYMIRQLQFRFIIASALDTEKGFEILYHFSLDVTGQIVNIRVVLDHERPEIESLTVLFEAANWIEREMHEILGIVFLNHPNLEKLISEGNWAEGEYPYRRNSKQ